MTMATPATPPGTAERERRREEIAAAACEVLAERGLAGTSVRQIARAAGVSLGTLPHYFADKEELLLHAHRYSYEGTTRRFLARPGPRTGLRALAGLLEDGLPLDDERRRYYRITKFGTLVARAEVRRLQDLVRLARASGFVPKGAS